MFVIGSQYLYIMDTILQKPLNQYFNMILVSTSIVRYAPLQIIVLEILDNIINGSTRHICPIMCQYTNCNTWIYRILFMFFIAN